MFIDKRDGYKDELERVQDYRLVFGSELGKKVLWDIARSAHFFQSTAVPGDAHASALREGERSTFLRILGIVERDPERIKELKRELNE
jgi:hypothetical protein